MSEKLTYSQMKKKVVALTKKRKEVMVQAHIEAGKILYTVRTVPDASVN